MIVRGGMPAVNPLAKPIGLKCYAEIARGEDV
jgi:hypothetical protein